MVVKLYKNDISPVSRACTMVCELLNVPAEMTDVDLLKGEHLTPEFLKKNPLHAIPVLEDGDLILHDSHAILIYLAEKYDKDGKLYPKDMKQRALVNQKLFFSISIVYMRLRDISAPLINEGEKPSDKRFKAIEETYGFLDEFLSRTKYLAGDKMTIADIAAFTSGAALGFLVELDKQKKIRCIPTVPVLEEGDFVLHDSHAILMYFAELYDKQNSLYPKDFKQRVLVDQKLFFNSSILFTRLRNITYPLIMEGVKPIEMLFKALDEAYGFLEAFLSQTKYLAGDNMTIADIAAYAMTSSLGFLMKLDGQKYPKVQAWLKELEQLPCAKKYNAPGLVAYEKFIKSLLAA